MKKTLKLIALSSLLLTSLITIGHPVELANAQTAETVDMKDEEKDSEENEEVEKNEEVEDNTDNEEIDWTQIEKDIQETLKAKEIEQVYQSSQAREFEENGLLSRLDGYALFKASDFSRDYKIQFEQTDKGYVLVFKIYLENNSDETVYFNNTPEVDSSNPYAVIAESKSMITNSGEYEGYFPVTEQEMEPGDTVEGIMTYYLVPEAAELVEADGTVFIKFYGFRDQEDFSGATQLLNPEFLLPLSKEKEELASASGDQYPDKIVSDNIGTKEVIEQEDTDASQEEEDLVVSVSGYEVSEIVPNEATKASFEDYPGGIIAINVKMDIQNNSDDQTVDLGGVYAKLVLGNQIQVDHNLYVEANDSKAEIAPGETGTTHMVYTIDGELWEKYKEDTLMIVPTIKDVEYEDMHDYQAIMVEFK